MDLTQIGRKILLWLSVFVFGFAFYEWFSHVYENYRAWESVRGAGLAFWDAQLAFWPLMVGLTSFLASGSLMLAWNFLRRRSPASEAAFLFWVGLAVATGFGWQLVLAIAYVSVGFTSGYPLLDVLQPAVPTTIGILMIVTTVIRRAARRARPAPVTAF